MWGLQDCIGEEEGVLGGGDKVGGRGRHSAELLPCK